MGSHLDSFEDGQIGAQAQVFHWLPCQRGGVAALQMLLNRALLVGEAVSGTHGLMKELLQSTEGKTH